MLKKKDFVRSIFYYYNIIYIQIIGIVVHQIHTTYYTNPTLSQDEIYTKKYMYDINILTDMNLFIVVDRDGVLSLCIIVEVLNPFSIEGIS